MNKQLQLFDDVYEKSPPHAKGLKQRLHRFFFGDDIFISYSRSDSGKYAMALAVAMSEQGYLCFLDQLGTDVNRNMPESLKGKVRNSTALVLIGTEGAAASRYVREEVEIFKESKRPIHPITIDGALTKEAWPELAGLTWISESRKRVGTGEPAVETITQLKNASRYRRRNQVLRLSLIAGFAFIAVTVLASLVVSSVQVAKAARAESSRIKAVAQATTAQGTAEQAKGETAKAVNDKGIAESAARKANEDADTARGEAKDAISQKSLAEAGTRQAQTLERAAKNRAETTARQEAGQRASVLARTPGREFDALEVVARAAHEDFQVAKPAPEVISGLVAAVSAVEDGLPLRGVQGEVTYVQISRDAKTLFVENVDRRESKVRWGLWNARTGEPLAGKPLFEKPYEVGPMPSQFYRGQSRLVRSTSFSADGTRLAVVEDTNPLVLRLWDLTSEAKPLSVKIALEHPYTIALDNHGQRLAMMSNDFNKIIIKDLENTNSESFRNPFSANLVALAFRSDNKLVIVGDSSSANPDESLQNELQAHNAQVLSIDSLVFNSFKGLSSNNLAIFSSDPSGEERDETCDSGTAKIYTTSIDRVEHVFSGYYHGVAVAAVVDGNPYVVTIDGGRAQIYGVRGDALVLRKHPGRVVYSLFSPDGRRAATVDLSGTSWIWELQTGQLYDLERTEFSGRVFAMAFSPDGKRLGMIKSSLVPKVWDVDKKTKLTPESGDCGVALDGRGGDTAILTQPRSIVFLPGNQQVLTMHRFGTLAIWDLGNLCKPLVHTLDRQSTVVAVAADGNSALTVGDGIKRLVKIWNLSCLKGANRESAKPCSTGDWIIPQGEVRAAWLHDGKARLLLVQNDWSAAIWQSDTKMTRALTDFAEQIHSATFSDDGAKLAFMTKDGELSRAINVWDSVTSEKLITIPGDFEVEMNDAPVNFSKDGAWLIAASRDNSTRIYPTTKEGFLGVADRMLSEGGRKNGAVSLPRLESR